MWLSLRESFILVTDLKWVEEHKELVALMKDFLKNKLELIHPVEKQ